MLEPDEKETTFSETITVLGFGLMLWGLVMWGVVHAVSNGDWISTWAAAIAVAVVQSGFVIGAVGFFFNIPAILRWIDRNG